MMPCCEQVRSGGRSSLLSNHFCRALRWFGGTRESLLDGMWANSFA